MQAHWQALTVLTVARTSMGFQFQSIASVSPDLVMQLGLTYADLGTLIGLYFLPGLALALPGAALGRHFGDKRVVSFGLLLMVAGGLATTWASDFASLAAARLLSGVGGVLLNVLMAKMVTDWFAGRREIVLAMAVFVNSFPIGVGLATLSLGTLAGLAGWGASLAATAALALAALLLLTLAYAKHPNDGIGTTVGGVISAPEAMLVCLAGAVWGIFNGAFAVMFGFAPTFLAGEGLNPTQAGLLVGVATWLVAASAPVGGIIAQTWGRPAMLMAVGALGWAACLATLALAIGFAGPALISAGLLMGLPIGVIMSMPSQALRPESRAVGMGLFYTWLYVGHGFMPPAAGWLQDLTGSAELPLLLTAMLVGGILPLYGLFQIVAQRRYRSDCPRR
ncbi:MFS transporter [Belnapia moabensis]|uniref:MFS transporter n=1 Tax=Belnapia moabensis TaxID=365533 RepID=UPI0005BA32A4|nr:MFS transporter [Belnapia moabensis]